MEAYTVFRFLTPVYLPVFMNWSNKVKPFTAKRDAHFEIDFKI